MNDNLLEIMKNRGLLASYLLSPLSKITDPENTIQLELVKDPNSNRVISLLSNNTKPIFYKKSCWHSVIPVTKSNYMEIF